MLKPTNTMATYLALLTHHYLNENTLANAKGKQLFINSVSPGPASLAGVIALNYTTKWKSWSKK